LRLSASIQVYCGCSGNVIEIGKRYFPGWLLNQNLIVHASRMHAEEYALGTTTAPEAQLAASKLINGLGVRILAIRFEPCPELAASLASSAKSVE
jgi:hypothetical protein